MAEDRDLSLGWVEQAKDFASPHLKVHVIHGASLGTIPEILEDLREALNGNDRLAGRVRSLPAIALLWRDKDCGLRIGFESCHAIFGVSPGVGAEVEGLVGTACVGPG